MSKILKIRDALTDSRQEQNRGVKIPVLDQGFGSSATSYFRHFPTHLLHMYRQHQTTPTYMVLPASNAISSFATVDSTSFRALWSRVDNDRRFCSLPVDIDPPTCYAQAVNVPD